MWKLRLPGRLGHGAVPSGRLGRGAARAGAWGSRLTGVLCTLCVLRVFAFAGTQVDVAQVVEFMRRCVACTVTVLCQHVPQAVGQVFAGTVPTGSGRRHST